MDIKTYSDLSASAAINKMGLANSIFRDNAIPLERWSVFNSYSKAKEYVDSAGLAYEGQIIAVTENEYSDWSAKLSSKEELTIDEVPSYTIEHDGDNNWTITFANRITGTAEGKADAKSLTFVFEDGQLVDPITESKNACSVILDRTYGATQNVYVLDSSQADGLKKINGTGSSSSGGSSVEVQQEKSRAVAAEAELQETMEISVENLEKEIALSANTLTGQISSLSDTVELSVGKLEENLKVTLSSVTGLSTDSFFKQYTLKQGGVDLGTIDIPKDFLVKSGVVSSVTAADVAEGGKLYGKGFVENDKYIDFVVNAISAGGDDQHIYINVKDLVDDYSAQKNATQVQLHISDTNEISAAIVAGSIGENELSANSVTNAKIADGAVTSAKIEIGAVTHEKLGLSSVTWENLSSDVQEKIGEGNDAVLSTAKKYTNEQISALDVAEKTLNANQTLKLIREDDGKISAEVQDIVISQNQISDLSGKTFIELSAVNKTPTADDQILLSSQVKTVVNNAIGELDMDQISVGADKTLKFVKQEDGKISAEAVSIQIAQTQVDGLTANLSAISAELSAMDDGLSAYVPLSVAEVASAGDMLVKASTVNTKITNAIEALDVDKIDVGADKTLKFVREDDGKISAEAVSIQISESQVSGLTADLSAISAELSAMDDGLSAYVTKTGFELSAQKTGFDRASETDKLTISSDVKSMIDTAVSALDSDTENTDVSSVVTKIEIVDGKLVPMTKAAIQITEDQVTGLKTDLQNLSDNYVLTSDVANYDKIDDTNKIVTSSDVSVAIDAAVKSIGDVLHFKGVSAYSEISAKAAEYLSGDVVLDSDTAKEYVLVTDESGNKSWREIGDETSYASKNVTVNGYKLENGAITLNGTDISVGSGDYALSTVADAIGNIDTRIDSLESALPLSVSNLTAADDYLSGQIDALAGNYLSNVVINDVTATVENHVAKFEILSIDCGGAVATV